MRADPEKHKKFTQSKFNIFLLHKPFYGFYKGHRGRNEEIYTDLKKLTQIWFAELSVFPGLREEPFEKPDENQTPSPGLIGYKWRFVE